ncbi:type II secretion system F family protein [Corynebacterium sp. YIM 101645]|uniref:Type II secretion system F family protein n=1 Tax=Corynebacterium lemuris TaxID=1859292 RepID=A0ABT2FWH0_9CORY|nr:type II secretion system F family protein [Corynebacterium lemuris]MCS5478309.1 type II secretion system F family protein [Corynebacterium lemuris]
MTALLLLAGHLLLPAPAPATRLSARLRNRTRLRSLLPLALGACATILLLPGSFSVAAAVVLIAGTSGWTVHDMRTRRRAHHRETVTAGFLGHLAGELRAGGAVSTAVEHSTANLPEDTPPELRGILQQVCAHLRRGVPGAHVLTDNATTPELAGLGTLWSLAERYGLPLAPLVEQAQLRIDTRLRHRTATAATLQGPQATAVILSLLPLAGIAMGTAMGADPLGLLLGGGLGGLLLVAGTGLAATGFVWSRYIIQRAAP